MIAYRIQGAAPEAHIFQVELFIPNPSAEGQILSLPAWIPGSYMIRDFARHLVSLTAWNEGRPVQVTKVDKQTWHCAPVRNGLRVTYEVYAWDLSVRAAYLDTIRGYYNGTSVFLQAEGWQHASCRVEILPPTGLAYEDWCVATTLNPEAVDDRGFGTYQAANYEELIDHPVEMGRFSRFGFQAAGLPHEVAISGRHEADEERLCRDLRAICEQQISLFRELPAERYLFIVLALGEGYGGLEHRASTSLVCSRDDLPRAGEAEIKEGYRRFLALCSHEYFHLWNVKRIRPRVFVEGGLDKEVHTRLLWVFEGITSYYDELALVRSGVIEPESYLELLARNISRLLRGSGRHKQSLADSSFDAWTKFYKQDENAPNAIVSYYTKGAVVALMLDLKIRLDSNGEKSLDDVMRELWRRYGRTGIGVSEEDVEPLIEEVTGLDLSSFFDNALRGTGELEVAGLLEQFAVGMRLRPARSLADEGGIARDSEPPEEPPAVLGACFPTKGESVVLTQVWDGGAAQECGLAAGDALVAIDGIRVNPDDLEQRIARMPRGRSFVVHAFRRDELMEFSVDPKPAPANTCELWLMKSPLDRALQRRRDWLTNGA